MAESSEEYTRPTDAVGRVLYDVSRSFAVLGGFLLVACALLTTVSIVSHATINLPVHGEFDLVTFGTSSAIYLFLPFCQITKGNIVVDFFFSGASPRTRSFLDALGSLLYIAVAVLILWRMSVGMVEVGESGESSAVLKLPNVWMFPVALGCLGLLILTTVYTFWQGIRGMRA